MYKTAIARIEGESSYGEALNSFREAYADYTVRGIKQSSNGWIAFIQKEAYQDQNVQDDIPAAEMAMDELPDPEDVEMSSPGADEEPDTEYEVEEEKQKGLMDELESALEKVESLIEEIKASEGQEEEVRPDFGPEDEEGEEMDEEGEEMPLDLEREKEPGLTLASATQEVEELIQADRTLHGYKVASVSETENSFIATLKKK